jgi:hypothetical protein
VGVRESTQSVTSGIASEANIPPLQQNRNLEGILSQEFILNSKPQKLQPPHKEPPTKSSNLSLRKQSEAVVAAGSYSTQSNAPPVTTENSINKITITFYQKRNQ